MAANLPVARFPYGSDGSSIVCGGSLWLQARVWSLQPGRGQLQLAAGGERMHAAGGERTHAMGLHVDVGPSSFVLWLLDTGGFGSTTQALFSFQKISKFPITSNLATHA